MSNNVVSQDQPITRLIKNVHVLSSRDSLRRAAGLMKTTDGSKLPVRNGESIYGVISERAISGFISAADDVDAALDSPIEPLVDTNVTLISPDTTLKQAAGVFAATGDDVLPVIGQGGSFSGVLYRRDVISLLAGNLRPPVVAGMATPLGVHLTTGSVNGGAGSPGLFLTGVSMAVMLVVSSLAVKGLQKLLTLATGITINQLIAYKPVPFVSNPYELTLYVSMLLSVLVFFALMRLSPLSGYHAAEHMTVHAIEAGDILTPETVRNMPRVHPRCGTNLLAGAGIFMVLAMHINDSANLILVLLVMVLLWRKVGGWLQYMVTTKRPSERQLANGIAAGNQLLQRYQERPNYLAVGWARIWNFGFIQTAAGMFLTLFLAEYVFKLKLM